MRFLITGQVKLQSACSKIFFGKNIFESSQSGIASMAFQLLLHETNLNRPPFNIMYSLIPS